MDNKEEKRVGGNRLVTKEKPPKKPKKPSKLKKEQKIMIAVAAALAVLVVGTLAWRSVFVRPDLDNKKPGVSGIGSKGEDKDLLEEIDYGDGIRPRADGKRKSEDYYTVLILGRDTGGGGNTDTILLASYDVTNQKATVMSIPRDTMVNVPWDTKKINSVYSYYGGGDRGIQYLYKEISQLVGFEPDYQVVVEWDAVGEIVDAMGGVYFEVPRNMNYDDPTQDLHIHQTQGYRLLSGDDAMQVIRYRHDNMVNGKILGYSDGDLGRIKTQQAFLTAMLEQLLKWKNLGNISEFIKVFEDNVETDLSYQNIFWFAQKAALGGLKMENVNFVTMPNTPRYVYSRSLDRGTGGRQKEQSYVVPNARQLLELVNNELSPFEEVFTMRDLDIMSVNADGSVSSSTGYVEDKQAALPPPEDEPEEDEPIFDENGNLIDPVTGEILDPETGEPIGPVVIDPVTGLPIPGTPGVTDPETTPPETTPGTTVPGTSAPGTTDPGTAPPPETGEPGVTDPGVQDPGTSGPDETIPTDPGVPEEPPLPDPGTSIIEPPPEG